MNTKRNEPSNRVRHALCHAGNAGDHDAGRTHLLSEQRAQQGLRGDLVASALNQDVEHDPVVIHRAPEPMFEPGNLHRDLLKEPLITSLRQPAADLASERLAELQAPLPYGFVADDDAASGEDLIDMAQANRDAIVEPYGEADDLGTISLRSQPLNLRVPVQHRKSADLESWVAEAASSLLASFINGIVSDQAAVQAALKEPWSNGQTEGQNTRSKLVKRQMYRRAKLNLLRARLLSAP